jgi:CubicO group peptidase (beta-lactamase class C family)
MDGRPLLLLLSLSWAGLEAQTPSSPSGQSGVLSRLDSIARALVADLPLASASVAVLKRRDTLVFAAYGYADIENRVRASPQTVYHIGSITKQFTAAAILQQVDRGRLTLDDDVATYVPELSWQGNRISIRQLLNHTSGLKDFGDLGDRFLTARLRDLPQRDVLQLVRDVPFASEPGTTWRYSNAGYYLLGVVLERVTGQRYADYLRERVWKAAKLTATGDCDPRAIVPHRARGYDAVGTTLVNAPRVSMSIPFSSEGLCSTAGDLVTWARALRDGQVISRNAYRAMTTPEGAAARATPPYGFGVWVMESGGRRYISHLGLFEGFNGVLSDVSPDSLTIAVLTNTSGFGASTLGGHLAAAILGIASRPVTKAVSLASPRGRALTRGEQERYVGRYEMRTIFNDDTLAGKVTLNVFDENGRLMAQLTGEPPEILASVKAHEFVAVHRPDLTFTFEVHSRRPTRVIMVGPAIRAEGPRVETAGAPHLEAEQLKR